jgi:hypothetical protein
MEEVSSPAVSPSPHPGDGTPKCSFPDPILRARDQAEADAEFGAGVKRAFWSCARELISSLR